MSSVTSAILTLLAVWGRETARQAGPALGLLGLHCLAAEVGPALHLQWRGNSRQHKQCHI